MSGAQRREPRRSQSQERPGGPRPSPARRSARPPGVAAHRWDGGRLPSHLFLIAAPPPGGVRAKIKPASSRPAPRLAQLPPSEDPLW